VKGLRGKGALHVVHSWFRCRQPYAEEALTWANSSGLFLLASWRPIAWTSADFLTGRFIYKGGQSYAPSSPGASASLVLREHWNAILQAFAQSYLSSAIMHSKLGYRSFTNEPYDTIEGAIDDRYDKLKNLAHEVIVLVLGCVNLLIIDNTIFWLRFGVSKS
jgi:hypothetical protein